MKAIAVKELVKAYRRPKPEGHWYKRGQYEPFKAIDGVTFEVERGEMVGYLGPNGAGKSTTIKLLTGVLTPSSGLVNVLGYVPYQQRYEYAYHIGVVFGQRELLWWDLPVCDSLELYAEIYELSREEFKESLELLSEVLGLKDLLHVPVRQLSLGQRKRCEFAASLLHKPDIIFMDEPMIALDVLVKERIRKLIRDVNKHLGTTIFLTTHDMSDVEELCDRVIILNEGKVVYDGSLSRLKSKYARWKTIEFEVSRINDRGMLERALASCEVVRSEGANWEVRVPSDAGPIPQIVEGILNSCSVVDLRVHTSKLELI
ncbi:ATP-binding cassette domain-containing protein, partial [bacterium]